LEHPTLAYRLFTEPTGIGRQLLIAEQHPEFVAEHLGQHPVLYVPPIYMSVETDNFATFFTYVSVLLD
jgi:hypothetical protein